MEVPLRFFSGKWDRTHVNTVKKVVDEHDWFGSPDTDKPSSEYNLEGLLNDLQAELLKDKISINPSGDLARRIEYIQEICNVKIINITELNALIYAAQANAHLVELMQIKSTGSK